MYAYIENTNASLQSVFGAIVEDINLMSERGIRTKQHGVPRCGSSIVHAFLSVICNTSVCYPVIWAQGLEVVLKGFGAQGTLTTFWEHSSLKC